MNRSESAFASFATNYESDSTRRPVILNVMRREVAVIKAETLSLILPQFFPAHWLEEAPALVFTPFPSRIRVGYVKREERSYSYLLQPEFEQFQISLEELHNLSLRNLRVLPCGGLTVGQTPGGPEAFLSGVEDNFHAVRILLPDVHLALEKKLGGEYFAAIPCRDWFVCWSTNQSAEWKQRNIDRARADFLADEYNLTPDILLRSDTGFTVHMVQAV